MFTDKTIFSECFRPNKEVPGTSWLHELMDEFPFPRREYAAIWRHLSAYSNSDKSFTWHKSLQTTCLLLNFMVMARPNCFLSIQWEDPSPWEQQKTYTVDGWAAMTLPRRKHTELCTLKQGSCKEEAQFKMKTPKFSSLYATSGKIQLPKHV